MDHRSRFKHLLASAVVLFAITASASTAQAWTPIDPFGTECTMAAFPPPATFDVCDYVLRAFTVNAVESSRLVCLCQLDIPTEPLCWALFGFCWGPKAFTDVASYVYYYEDLECNPSLKAVGDLVEDLVLRAAEYQATIFLGGVNSAFYTVVGEHLTLLECYSQPLSSNLKDVMRHMRDEVGFDDEESFHDVDLDTMRILSGATEGASIYSDNRNAITLGHLVIIDPPDAPYPNLFNILSNWSRTWADVVAGRLCPDEKEALSLIMHEAVHVKQYRHLGKETFVNQYLPDLLISNSKEGEAYTFSGSYCERRPIHGTQPSGVPPYGAVDVELDAISSANPGAAVSCSSWLPNPPASCVPGAIAMGPGTGPQVRINSICNSMMTCAPAIIECDQPHAAALTLDGFASDPSGIVQSDWFLSHPGGGSTPLGTGFVVNTVLPSQGPAGTGRHSVNFSAKNGAYPALVSAAGLTVDIRDTLPPMITPNPGQATIECNMQTYVETGAVAADICDPTATTATPSGSVNRSILGPQDITYTAIDDVLNVGSVRRTVTVVDTHKPTIIAPADIVTQDRTPNLGSATMGDTCDPSPLAQNDAPATFPYGTTVVTWWSVDDANNMSATDTQLVTVIGGDGSTAGRDFSCGAARDGDVYCWGIGAHGQIGNASFEDRYGPTAVTMTGAARQVSTGSRHACMVKTDGRISCWGQGEDGRLGNNSTTTRSAPSTTVSGITTAVQVSAGGRISGLTDDGHSCAVLSNGTVRCWGEGGKGQLGAGNNNDSLIPVTATIPPPVIINLAQQVTTGGEHSCVVDMGGRISCWGEGDDGRLGLGTTADKNAPNVIPPTTPAATFAQVDAGERHTCAVDTVGRVWCWGEGANGRLGLGTTNDRTSPFQVTLPGGATAVQVSAGSLHSCAVTTDGRVFCWGSPLSGRLGDGAVITDQLSPIQATGIVNAIAVSAGFDHTCARIKDGASYFDRCWGDNFNGELGDGTDTARAIGSQISQNCGWTSSFFPTAAGAFHTCSTMTSTADARTMCWGENAYGQLGAGDYEDRLAPWPVVGTTGALVTGAGATHSCSLTSAQRPQCWGDNLSGQLGDNTIDYKLLPVLASDFSTYSMLVTGGYHTCGVTTGNVIQCWGNNEYGQVGNNTVFNQLVPTPVVDQPAGTVLWLTAGYAHTCAVIQNGGNRQVWCWGRGLYGQLGHNSPFDNWTPVRAGPDAGAGSINDAVQVSAGRDHTCATTTSGAVWCWGRNYNGQIGNNSFSDTWVPVRVINQSNVQILAPSASIASGSYHSCVMMSATGEAACWGDNTYGQLGTGALFGNPRAQTIAGMTNVVSVTAGQAFSCAKIADPLAGNITKCWGANDSGQLGDGTITNRSAPVRVAGACY